MLNHLWNTSTLILGVLLSALGLGSFLLPNHFIDGGITGISMLLATQTGWPLSIFLVIVNIPFVILGDRHLGRQFAIKSAMAILGLAICLALIRFPIATSDKLLGSVFGKGGYSDADTEILLCVVTRLEEMKLESLVEQSDSNA